MRDIEQLIREWEYAADSDGIPPAVTEEERQALAVAYMKAEAERGKIHGWPILGISFNQARRAEELGSKMRSIHGFVRETLPGGVGTNAEAQAYIKTAGATRRGFSLRGIFGKH